MIKATRVTRVMTKVTRCGSYRVSKFLISPVHHISIWVAVMLLGDRLRGRDGGRVERGGGEGRRDRPGRGGSDVVAEVSHGPARQYPLLLGRTLRLGEGEEGERPSRGDRLLPLALQRDE